MTSDTVTIMRTLPGRLATKSFTWNPTLGEIVKRSYEAGNAFTIEERRVADLAELAPLVEELRRDDRAFLVRGEPTPDVRAAIADDPGRAFRRRKNEKGTARPTLAEVDRRWLMIDVDKWPLPPWADIADDPEPVIDAAIRDLLPEPFHDALCFWQFSASAGIATGELKVHLFFWLDRPMGNKTLREYFRSTAPLVDTATFNAVQPHYIADPIFEGSADPIPRRTGWRQGLNDVVPMLEIDTEALRRSRYVRREDAVRRSGLSAAAASTVDGALALLGDGDGLDGFHQPLRTATWLYARRTPEDARDDETLKTKIRAAIEVAPRDRGRSIEEYSSDLYLDRLIDGAYLAQATHQSAPAEAVRPYFAAPIHDVDDARRVVQERIAEFFARAVEWHAQPEEQRATPEQAAVAMDVGGGKSTIGRKELALCVERLRARSLPHRVLWGVPTHKLGAEAAQHFDKLSDLTIAVWRGRRADNPVGAGGEKMCLDLGAVAEAVSAGENVETAVCGKPDGSCCPFFERCGYQKQKAAAASAHVVIAAHNVAFSQLPPQLRTGLALTVLDESWWQCGLQDWELTAGTLASDPSRYPVLKRGTGGKQLRDDEATNDLHSIRATLSKARAAAVDGYLRRDTLAKAGLTGEMCRMARGLEWRRRIDGLMRPGMPMEERRIAAERGALNAQIPRIAALWTELETLLDGEQEATGRVELAHKETVRGAERLIGLHVRREMITDVASRPILNLDARLPEQNVRHYLPRLQVLADMRIKAPHQVVRHVVGGFGKTSLIGHGKQSDGENRRRKWKVEEIRDFIALHANGEPTLVVTYKEMEAEFQGMPNVQVAHFNAVAGLDRWGKVRHCFVIGRPLPIAEAVRIMAAALSGRPVPTAEPVKETRGLLMADGSCRVIDVRAYEDPDAEAVRAAIMDTQVLQSIGRARGVNRTADTPVRSGSWPMPCCRS